MSEDGQPGRLLIFLLLLCPEYFHKEIQAAKSMENLRSLGVSQNHPFRYVICVSNEFYICVYIIIIIDDNEIHI